MSAYKVPQDVEAEDKLLGPFSMRQFIYLIVAFGLIALGWAFSRILLPLALIPVPLAIVFFVLALPLKKDQPMETYLLALVSFYFLKPRKRLWQPDGINALVEITAPKEPEPERAKDITADEARNRLGYLTDIIDSRGWAVRGTGIPSEGVSSMHEDTYQEAQRANDMLDEDNAAAQKFDRLISTQKQEHMSAVRDSMEAASINPDSQQYTAMPQPQQQANPQTPVQSAYPSQQIHTQTQPNYNNNPPQQGSEQYEVPSYNPYPDNIKQSVIQPLQNYSPMNSPDETGHPNSSTSISEPSPDIMRLVNETDGLTVASVAREAQRIEGQQEFNQSTPSELSDGEVHISLR